MNIFLKENEQNIIDDIIKLISIPSVASAADGEKFPFGRPVADALCCVLDMAAEMGFKCKNYDNYVAEISIGSGDVVIGVLCHVDVVDAGEGWKTDPFRGVVIDGQFYGRGIIDDKGPLISCLYAMKYIKESDLLPLGYKIMMIIGTDEEENWESIDYYLNQNPTLPEVSIVPDANFPVISCEKGLINLEFILKNISPRINENVYINELDGGERANVVPAKAVCILKSSIQGYDFKNERAEIERQSTFFNIPVEIMKGEHALTVSVKGKAAHAMTPEKGINAVSYLMKILAGINPGKTEKNQLVSFYNRYIGTSYDGSGLGCNICDDPSGSLTVNVGIAQFKNDEFRCSVNLRYPVTYQFEEIKKRISNAVTNETLEIKWGICMNPIFFESDSHLVESLMEVYQQETGDYESKPIALGGATYARAIPNAVAFGPVFPNQEELAHEPNEHYSIADIKRITTIYAKALLKLCK